MEPQHKIVWVNDEVPLHNYIMINSKNQVHRKFSDGRWIFINKRGLAKGNKSVIIGV